MAVNENGKWQKGNIDGGIAFERRKKKNPLNNEIIWNEFVLAPLIGLFIRSNKRPNEYE